MSMNNARIILGIVMLLLGAAEPTFGGGTTGVPPPPSSGGGGSPPPPPSTWVPYGYQMPGDPVYSLGAPDPNTQSLVGWAARGNIVLGDYTSADFQTYVIPKLKPGQGSVTQPYVVDPADQTLGYVDYYDAQGRPVFNGDYNRPDNRGNKPDGSPRKYYESTLADADFQALIAPEFKNANAEIDIQGVLFTNHALAGLVSNADVYIRGTLVARDDALMFGNWIQINHDIRLLSDKSNVLELPFSIKRPRLLTWKDCYSDAACQ